MSNQIVALLIIFQLKHWLVDYRFQTPYMLRKGAGGLAWVWPLTAHASVHAFLTLLIVAGVAVCRLLTGEPYPLLWAVLPIFDLLIHFIVDRIKAAPSLGGRWNPSQPQFWRALGADQMAHHLTHYAIIFFLLQ
jgi:hypothetical protein